MIESLKARWVVVVVTLVMGLITMIPNFVEVGEGWIFSKDKLNYGLDIQGGLHLVLGVDVDGVVAEKTARTVANLPEDMKDQGVSHGALTTNPENKRIFTIAVSGADQQAQVVKYIEDFYPVTLQILDQSPSAVELQIYDAKIQEYKRQTIDQAIEVIRNRIDEFGVSEPNIAAQGDNRIIVQLPGLEDAARAKDLINRTAKLNFRPVHKETDPSDVQSWVDEAEEKGGYALGKDDLRYGDYIKRLNADLKDKMPKDTMVVFEKAASAATLEAGKIPFLIETDNDVTGDLLDDAAVRPDEFGRPKVAFRFGVEGRRKFGKMSEENIGNQVAIVLDDVIKSAPTIQSKITDAGEITLGSSNVQEATEEANFIATTLRAGALPAALEQLEERTVGPTLGQDSIEKGKKAGIIGGILVLIFMILYYRGLGVIADVALTINILFILAILTSLGATLTLPGVAGIVLTVGMAVDANVIIFERIKEELRKGSGLLSAVKDGYGHAFSAIVDANITTAAVCVVLMYFGTGPVRGFAVTLICGIVTSMFTAIFVSRAIIDVLILKWNVKNLVKV